MDKRVTRIINKIRERKLRRKVFELIQNPTIKIGDKTYSGIPIQRSPARFIRHHHNYPGGFIEHTLALYGLCRSLSRIVKSVYGCRVDEDILWCGVLLHDIFKPTTYIEKQPGEYVPSQLSERIDHLTLASAELIRREFPLDVVHVVTASHGREHGPMGPMTIEALILHLADETEAKLNDETLRAAKFMIREVTGQEPRTITGREAFSVVRSKVDDGWEGVRKYLDRAGFEK